MPGQQTTATFSNVTVTGASVPSMQVPIPIENNINEKTVALFPNPASDQLTLQFNELDSSATLNMYDQLGRRVLTKAIEPETHTLILNLTDKDLKSGVYYLDVRFRDQHLVKKVVITK